MSESGMEQATKEIDDSLKYIKFSMRRLGLSFGYAPWPIGQRLIFVVSMASICYHVFGDVVYMVLIFARSPRLEDIIPYFHTFGFGVLSIAKVLVLWYKKDVFSQLIDELRGIWPASPLDEDAQEIKDKSLAALNVAHRWYFLVNAIGVWFYILTPIVSYFYELRQGLDAQLGYIWASWYPFDKHAPIGHCVVYIFESFIGVTCVWIVVATDLLFTAMASHICLLLRLLYRRLEILAYDNNTNKEYYRKIIENIKMHQRLITYCNDLEDVFSTSNFINYFLSSINICCVVFVIVLLESPLVISNKLFIISALIQIGLICWYGDEILHANSDIAMAAYNSGWYQVDPRCRRALLFLMIRAQKPIAFTALQFTNISLVTYSSILTNSYSYFALLYTMYSNN